MPIERLRSALRSRIPKTIDDPGAIRCAVLVPILGDGDDPRILYTRRSEHLPDHRGQVAFPGGKRSPRDAALIDTALRETEEEVGIERGQVEIIGRLDDVPTVATRYIVTPYVGIIDPGARIRPNPDEVAAIFFVSLDALSDPETHVTRVRSWNGATYEVDVIQAGEHEIWGVTLAITRNLITCMDHAGG